MKVYAQSISEEVFLPLKQYNLRCLTLPQSLEGFKTGDYLVLDPVNETGHYVTYDDDNGIFIDRGSHDPLYANGLIFQVTYVIRQGEKDALLSIKPVTHVLRRSSILATAEAQRHTTNQPLNKGR